MIDSTPGAATELKSLHRAAGNTVKGSLRFPFHCLLWFLFCLSYVARDPSCVLQAMHAQMDARSFEAQEKDGRHKNRVRPRPSATGVF